MPLHAAVSAMEATLKCQKKGLSRKSKSQKGHLTHKALLEAGRMLTEEELGPLLRDTAREYTDLVENAEKRLHLTKPEEATAVRAQKLVLTCMALGIGVAARGGDPGRLTLKHVDEAAVSGYITLESHKTAATHGALVLPCPPWLVWMLKRWIALFRPSLEVEDVSGDSLFLSGSSGKPLEQASKHVLTPYIKEKTGKHITFTAMRKFYETVSFHSFDDATQRRISQAQCHNDATARAHYQLRDMKTSAEASHAAFDARLGLSAAIAPVVPVAPPKAATPPPPSPAPPAPVPVVTPAIVVVPTAAAPAPITAVPKTKTPAPAIVPGQRRAWTREETDALLVALAHWEHKCKPKPDDVINWEKIQEEGQGKLDARAKQHLKDKTRVFKAEEIEALNKYRDDLGVAPEHRRQYVRATILKKRSAPSEGDSPTKKPKVSSE